MNVDEQQGHVAKLIAALGNALEDSGVTDRTVVLTSAAYFAASVTAAWGADPDQFAERLRFLHDLFKRSMDAAAAAKV